MLLQLVINQISKDFLLSIYFNQRSILVFFPRESSDSTTQPPLLSFKNYLLDQDDNIDQEEAVKRYNIYKTDFKKTQIAEFFTAHKDEEWFVDLLLLQSKRRIPNEGIQVLDL
jgi:hypothetical protein